MITVSCPVRISLIGGSSDLDAYIDKHGSGSVISFTPNLYTYVSVYRDVLGKNNLERKYIVNYSQREEVTDFCDIKNDLVREYFQEKYIEPCSVHMTSDIFSHGSGLAVSSSYSCSLVMAINEMMDQRISNIECGMEAHSLEKKINPLLGLQDVFGCCVGGFKKIKFNKNAAPVYTFLPTKMFDYYDVYLKFTGYTRSSTEQLKNIVVPDTDTFNPLVDSAEQCLIRADYGEFMHIIKEGWNEKKRTSKTVLNNPKLLELDSYISKMKGCASHKLCGAGNGGFFLSFFERGCSVPSDFYKIDFSPNGVRRLI
jgi:D-glycero-alpha-D-manno-heptose-7-phosphate kinase